MNIRIESLLEGAGRAIGAVAIIDVFRAFTTAAVVLSEGAERIIMVGTEEEALATGLTLDELRSRSFVKILAGRRGT